MNKQLLQQLPVTVDVYIYIDTTCDTNETFNYPIEFLNLLESAGVPSYILELKSGEPKILLRNL